MDAHNCYPYFGWWADRIDRALSAGTPLAIEQDLFWYTNPRTGQGRSLVTHGAPSDGNEPNMRDYFFERVRPIVEGALHATAMKGDAANNPRRQVHLLVMGECLDSVGKRDGQGAMSISSNG